MAGHSHWANIQHKKGIADAKRGKVWSKFSRLIMIAARNGGGDPVMNLRLRYAIDKARAISMPKDNIERAIKRGTGELAGEAIEELTYEGFGPGSTAVLIEVMTDNRARTSGEIRKILERSGGKLGSAGNVAFLFERKGLFSIDPAGRGEDDLVGVVLDAGAEDLQLTKDGCEITCDPASFNQVKEGLEKAGLTIQNSQVSQIAKASREVDLETGQKIARMMEALDDHDDVQNVYTDADLRPEMMAAE
jgi:YebC/PmpR family DNA-binding regulatory protein